MSFFSKKSDDKKGSKDDKHCFNCGKEITGDGYTKAHGRYCCEKCCSKEGEESGGEKCEFC